jgi:hypothetical protein
LRQPALLQLEALGLRFERGRNLLQIARIDRCVTTAGQGERQRERRPGRHLVFHAQIPQQLEVLIAQARAVGGPC